MRKIAWAAILVLLSKAFGQSPESVPKFEIADVHNSAKTPNPFVRTGPARGGRYEVRTASMLDLVRIAYGMDPDKVLGGPNWLELDRFDVIAKVPADSTPETQKLMLQGLLADRFKLVVHKETKPLPAYVLTAGKSPKLKEADASGETGCKMETASGPPREGVNTLRMMDASGKETAIVLGPGQTVHYICRNMAMAAFAAGLRGMLGAAIGPNPVADETGLKGSWNFDIRYSIQFFTPNGDSGGQISIFDALDKQLGLKLEQKPVPTPVVVVDSVNRTATPNPAGVAEAFPVQPPPTEFEVADVKLTNPDQRFSRFQTQPGGRVNIQGIPMRFLIGRAFSDYGNDQLIGVPKWADTARFDITALAPEGSLSGPMIDQENLATMLRALLKDQFKMTWHTDERTVPAYTLVAAKPKFKKADPESRISCKTAFGPPAAPQGSISLTCENTTMAQLAERLRSLPPGFGAPILDSTGLDGGWDFSLTYSQLASFPNLPRPAAGDGAQPGALPQASDPVAGYSLFEAIEKQLGVKLEKQPRTMPVVVIDHLEQRPIDN
ncbi:MAG: TIGR03435 family protein [Bryobacterales bacterium]|nr:TIGR03435 family protein [Bryobacterales bacterium]MBV9400887.1 TIGR03435 family protein [Bryobacterales bacterium]